MSDNNRILITGATGSYGTVVIPYLAAKGYKIFGVDLREPKRSIPGVTFYRADIMKRSFDNVLRTVEPHTVIHLARVNAFSKSRHERHRINFEGTIRVVENSLKNNVQRFILGSRATVYGALPAQPQFVTEEHPPSAGRMFAQMDDLVSSDLYTSGMLWRYPEKNFVILRFVNVIGPRINSLLARYLKRRRVFTIMGFDPVYQVMHEEDMAESIRLSLEPEVRGIFNVTGPGEVPLHVLIDAAGGTRIPLVEGMVGLFKGRMGFPSLPKGAIAFLKFPSTVDGSRFREATGFTPKFNLRETINSLR